MTMIGLRKAWFQVHKWIGLILAVLIIPLSLSGSALVWHDEIERGLHPERYAVTGAVRFGVDDYYRAANAALAPEERLSRLEIPMEAGSPVRATAVKVGKGRPVRTTLYLDPATAKLIGSERSGEGLFAFFHVLHGSLLVPGVGRQIVGWLGVAMLIMSLTGLWLWWPLSGSFTRGMRWKRHPKNTDSNLHHLAGFWISVPLFLLSLTGIWISFPAVFAGIDGGQGGGPNRAAFARARPLAAAQLDPGTAAAKAQAAMPGTVVAIGWPTDLKPEWTIDIEAGKGKRSVTVDDADGTAKAAPAARDPAKRGRSWAQFMRQLHDGGDMPFLWQLVIFIGGILPALLAVTGIIMWWRARGWRGEVAANRRAAGAG